MTDKVLEAIDHIIENKKLSREVVMSLGVNGAAVDPVMQEHYKCMLDKIRAFDDTDRECFAEVYGAVVSLIAHLELMHGKQELQKWMN